jgi:LmbE family N-acetylglucosaminyl deacetylase
VQPFTIAKPGQRLKVLCLGAHSDDIEIGVGGTLLSWVAAGALLDVHWCVLSACGPRRAEAMAGANAILEGAVARRIECAEFRDSHFPYQGAEIKAWIEDLKMRVDPDVVFTHRDDDAHQDHREVSRLTWNAFRDHVVLEYEIPKWDGDIGRPNLYVAMSGEIIERKIRILQDCFGTQRSKDWFDADTFRGLARIRGMECRAPGRFAEAFVVRKLLVDCVPQASLAASSDGGEPQRSSRQLSAADA